jgi:hypothetical protein
VVRRAGNGAVRGMVGLVGLVGLAAVTSLAGCDTPDGTAPTAGEQVPVVASSTAAPALDDHGYGALTIGMTENRARGTGLLGAAVPFDGACRAYHGRGGVDRVYVQDGRVSIIAVGPGVRTTSGIGVGSRVADIHAAYPELSIPGDDSLGRIYVPAAGGAAYRIGIDADSPYPDARVTEIALQAGDQGCYE